MSMTG